MRPDTPKEGDCMMDPKGFFDVEEGARHARARRAFEARQSEMLAAFRRDKELPQPVGTDRFEAGPDDVPPPASPYWEGFAAGAGGVYFLGMLVGFFLGQM